MKTILITGSTDGIGLATASELACQGHRVILHGRNPDKLAAAREQLAAISQGEVPAGHVADLSRLAEAAALAAEVEQSDKRIDVLINNAGVYRTPDTRTADGLDVRFAVNTLAPYVLARRLAALLGDKGRVVNLASAAQAPVSLAALAGTADADGDFDAYAQSKLALIMWTRDLAARSSAGDPMVVAVNPGSLLASKMVKEGFGVAGNDLSIGVDILVRAALSEEFDNAGGQYYDNDGKGFSSPHAHAMDDGRCRRLVEAMEEVLEHCLG
ncbi:SDR family NAD(P)-dependent oxidoreductase [Halomonas sp. DN3]|uniref:SDR family NAD(P)-dependent oxidoreductase n=1 Tax=Halomonas sp. DN3 TaxID=2953657 RepID=UPI0020A048A2|nr:SDR family NAD(P)-dependent oxidoreductase [Halomonas sp. DN3]USZ48776.1 SDR family NAD(P)-dependent oxidoreductase [Halomonas sp. DN3]